MQNESEETKQSGKGLKKMQKKTREKHALTTKWHEIIDKTKTKWCKMTTRPQDNQTASNVQKETKNDHKRTLNKEMRKRDAKMAAKRQNDRYKTQDHHKEKQSDSKKMQKGHK